MVFLGVRFPIRWLAVRHALKTQKFCVLAKPEVFDDDH